MSTDNYELIEFKKGTTEMLHIIKLSHLNKFFLIHAGLAKKLFLTL